MSAGITEETRAGGELQGGVQAGPGGPGGRRRGEHFITGLASKAPSSLQLLCLNFRFTGVFEVGFLGICLRMNFIFWKPQKSERRLG